MCDSGVMDSDAKPAPEPLVDEFDPARIHLNTASMGLPPRRTVAAVRAATDAWASGTVDMEAHAADRERARSTYADLTGIPVDQVFTGSQTAALVGLVATSLPDGAEVLVAAGDYGSLTLPFLAQQPRIRVRTAPLASLADRVGPATHLVAVSLAQSATGELVDLAALRFATASVGAEIMLDITQSAGWWPEPMDGIGYTACSAYKWLMSPRGTAFGSVRADLVDRVRPVAASVDAQRDEGDFYPDRHRPAASARRFDVSFAWPAWTGAAASLGLLAELGVARVHGHGTGLATRCADALGVVATGSPILALPVAGSARQAVQEAGVQAAFRAGRLRLAFHLHNHDDDLDRVVDVVRPHLITDR